MATAAARLAPVEGPENMPSVRAAWRAVSNAWASGNGHDFVVVGGVELGWAVADAAALDVMGPRWPARQHRRFGRLDNDPVHVRQCGGQRAGDTQEAASGADIAAEGADGRRAGELIDQFLTEAAVAVHHVGVIELIGGERACLCRDLGCPAHHCWDQIGRDAIRARYQLDLGAERPHRADLLLRERIRGHDPQRVALDCADERQGRAGASTGVLDHQLARPQAAVGLSGLDHRQRHPVLVRASGVGRFHLHPDLGATLTSHVRQPGHGRTADRRDPPRTLHSQPPSSATQPSTA